MNLARDQLMSLELKWILDTSPACFHVVDLLLRQDGR
jgi:hypothetical protein